MSCLKSTESMLTSAPATVPGRVRRPETGGNGNRRREVLVFDRLHPH